MDVEQERLEDEEIDSVYNKKKVSRTSIKALGLLYSNTHEMEEKSLLRIQPIREGMTMLAAL